MPEDIQNEVKTFTQEELDKIVNERLARDRKKYADYEDLAEKAKLYDEQQDANKSELEKLMQRAEEAESKISAYEQEKSKAALIEKVMKEHGIGSKFSPLLTATDEDGLKEQAELIKERFAEPVPSDTGKQPNAEADATAKFARELFGGKNQ